jgi:hypothetical protein
MPKICLLSLLLCLLSSPLLADTPVDNAVRIARQEWERFGQQTIDKDGKIVKPGGLESQDPYWRRVGDYWKSVGLDLSGKDTDEPWSAAFMSWVMRQAGMGDRFSYSEWHATYIRNSIFARRDGDKHFAYWGYRLGERAPQLGDLVGYARQGGVSYDYQPLTYASHTDLVVAVRPHEIDVIGGNVKDSVSMKTLRTDDQGHLIDKANRWFVVMAPNP